MDKFLENLESYGIGEVTHRLGNLQDKIVEAVQESGLVGKLKLDLTFKRVGATGVAVTAKITPVIPEKKIQTVEMFVDENHKLHESDPNQIDFDNVTAIKDTRKVNQV